MIRLMSLVGMLSKEVWKLNFRQYGEMEMAHPGRSSDVEKSEGRNSDVEKVRREKMQVREKVGKSRNTVFFQCFVAREGRKVGSLKRRVRR